MDAVTRGLTALLGALGASPGPALPEQLAALSTLKSKLGRKDLAAKLGLNEHELGAFEATLADVQRWEGTAPGTPRRDEFIHLSSLLTLQWLEVLCPRLGAASPAAELTSTLTDETAAAHVRALELVLRELIHESYRGQDALLARLREVFKGETIAKWTRSAGSADVLTGMSFGELASFFVNRDEYPRYQPLLEVEQYLAMMRERRKTLRTYLDALRLARNTLAHHKPLSAVQRLLVEHFAKEIFAPVSLSWREGRTTVNPDTHLLASTDGLRDWLAALTDDVREVQDELAALKEEVAGTKRDVSALEGAVLLMLLSGLFFLFTLGVTAWGALTAPPTVGLPDMEAAGVTVARTMRGLLFSAATFGLAVVRIVLNLTVFKGGGAGAVRGWLTGRRALLPLGAWTALGLALFLAPIRLAAVEDPFFELNAQTAFLGLDEAGVESYLARGGNPNAVVNGNTLIHNTIIGITFVDGGDVEGRRRRILQRLLDAGAKPTQADRDFVKVMEKRELLPMLEP